MSAQQVSDVLTSTPLAYTDEDSLQAAIHEALTDNGLPSTREVPLGGRLGRIDLMSGSVGIEVKVQGGLNDVMRQLLRYSNSEGITELVLVTTKAAHHRIPTEFNGKPVHLVSLIEGGL